jgi:hypothetical protein
LRWPFFPSAYGKLTICESSYRLNVFGWVASEALKEDNAKAGDPGVGNYGITNYAPTF